MSEYNQNVGKTSEYQIVTLEVIIGKNLAKFIKIKEALKQICNVCCLWQQKIHIKVIQNKQFKRLF